MSSPGQGQNCLLLLFLQMCHCFRPSVGAADTAESALRTGWKIGSLGTSSGNWKMFSALLDVTMPMASPHYAKLAVN